MVQYVDATGEVKIADIDQNPNMWWMARGGGGNFPGIVTAFQMQAFARPEEVYVAHCTFGPEDAKAVAKAWLAQGEEMVHPHRKLFTSLQVWSRPRTMDVVIYCYDCDFAQKLWMESAMDVIARDKASRSCVQPHTRAWLDQILYEAGHNHGQFKPTGGAKEDLLNCSSGWGSQGRLTASKSGGKMGYEWLASEGMLDEVLDSMFRTAPEQEYGVMLEWYLTGGPKVDEIHRSATAYGPREAKWVLHYKHQWEPSDAAMMDKMMTHHVALSKALDRHLLCTNFYNYVDNDMSCAATNDDWLAAYFSDVPLMKAIKLSVDPDNVFRSRLLSSASDIPGWTLHSGLNCYHHAGADLLIGNDHIAESITLDECRAACEHEVGCEAVVVFHDATHGSCWLRTSISLSLCPRQPQYDVWERNDLHRAADSAIALAVVPTTVPQNEGWIFLRGLNCFPGHGAMPVEGSDDQLEALSLADCKAACSLRGGACDAVVVFHDEDPGSCWLRRDVQTSFCQAGTGYNLWLRPYLYGTLSTSPLPSVSAAATLSTSPLPSVSTALPERLIWAQHKGILCDEGFGAKFVGDGADGAESSPRTTVGECQALCARTSACEAIVVEQGAVPTKCLLRRRVELPRCAPAPTHDVWMLNRGSLGTSTQEAMGGTFAEPDPWVQWLSNQGRGSWRLHSGFNCFPGAGAESVGGTDFVGQMTAEQCKITCHHEDLCTAIVSVRGQDFSECWLRSTIQLAQCHTGTPYDLYIRTDVTTTTTTTTPASSTSASASSRWAASGSASSQHWVRHRGTNCWTGAACEDIPDVAVLDGGSLSFCRSACESEARCHGFVYKAESMDGFEKCWLKSTIDIQQSRNDQSYEIWLLLMGPPWTYHRGFNCFPGAGAVALPGKDHISVGSLDGCKAACKEEPLCEGLVVVRNQNPFVDCWLRTRVSFAGCWHDSAWDFWSRPDRGQARLLTITDSADLRCQRLSQGSCRESGLHPITQQATCEAAARLLELDDQSAVLSSAERLHGCFLLKGSELVLGVQPESASTSASALPRWARGGAGAEGDATASEGAEPICMTDLLRAETTALFEASALEVREERLALLAPGSSASDAKGFGVVMGLGVVAAFMSGLGVAAALSVKLGWLRTTPSQVSYRQILRAEAIEDNDFVI